MSSTTRREALGLITASVLGSRPSPANASSYEGEDGRTPRACRIRTITVGVPLAEGPSVGALERPLAMLARAKTRFENEGYEVQTTRITTPPVAAQAGTRARRSLLSALVEMDGRVVEQGVRLGIGPVLADDRTEPDLADWAAEIVTRTKLLNFTVAVATPRTGPMPNAAETAARIMYAIAKVGTEGLGNFRFAAAANVPSGTPFFPVGYHEGAANLALGLEGAGVIGQALTNVKDAAAATRAVRDALGRICRDIERIASSIAAEERVLYRGIDPSPAPGMDRSIGAALEALISAPFGTSGTLEACAAVTGALKSLEVRTCGYAGLMFPLAEDPRLAQRASEGRVGVDKLLLYSSVCGTGLDCIPLAGDTPVEELTRLIRDVAALAARWQKALSVRALLVPGKRVGELATFDDPLLTPCRVLPVA